MKTELMITHKLIILNINYIPHQSYVEKESFRIFPEEKGKYLKFRLAEMKKIVPINSLTMA